MKIYNYFVSYNYTNNYNSGFGNAELQLNYKLDNFDAIQRANKLISKDRGNQETIILFYKELKSRKAGCK